MQAEGGFAARRERGLPGGARAAPRFVAARPLAAAEGPILSPVESPDPEPAPTEPRARRGIPTARFLLGLGVMAVVATAVLLASRGSSASGAPDARSAAGRGCYLYLSEVEVEGV